MCKNSASNLLLLKTINQSFKFINHCIIIACDTEYLGPGELFLSGLLLRAHLINNTKVVQDCHKCSCKVQTWVHTTSTRLRSIFTGVPLLSNCTVTAMYTLWFGDVHASMAKLNVPSSTCSLPSTVSPPLINESQWWCAAHTLNLCALLPFPPQWGDIRMLTQIFWCITRP